MKLIDQIEIFSTVNKKDDNLLAETVLIGRNVEAKAALLVDVNKFLIKDAPWEINKAPDGIAPGCGSAAMLRGIEAHIEGKKQMKLLLQLDGGIILKYLFTNCVKALIQAETFVYQERGFADAAAYNTYWESIEKNGCRGYSHPVESDQDWLDYAAEGLRGDNLFNRCRHYMLMETADGQIEAMGGFQDSFHELGVKLTIDRVTGVASQCEIDFARAPGNACYENRIHAEKFIGRSIFTLTKMDIIDAAGRGEGCYHLVDLISEVSALLSGRSVY